jgi:DNA invertase Pin-like site-specific DNA recombinase
VSADDDSTAGVIQRRLCQDAAERSGEHIPPQFKLQDTAHQGHQRSGLDAALQLVVTGQIKTLYVGTRLERLTRRDASRFVLILDELEQVGGRIVFVADELDTARPDDRLIIAHLGEQAHTEAAARLY